MKTFKIYIYAVVLWALVECGHGGRLGRSLDVEGKGSNLTQKQQQEVIHADILQHFTTTPTTPTESSLVDTDTAEDSTSSYIKDVPFIPEDFNVQSLKNDDHFRVTYDRKITIDKENPNVDSPEEKNKTSKSETNDVISYEYNHTGPSTSTRSQVLISHSSYEHSSTSVVYDDDDDDHDDKDDTQTVEYRPAVSSTTETFKADQEGKIFDIKKKEKGKKEILDSVTVPTDFNGSGRVEKPYKDNIISGKLKEKNKDSIPEALDERRSTTTRISDSSSVSVSDPLGSVDPLKTDSSDEGTVNQSVNSVINAVNSVSKKSRVKYSVKRAETTNDTEADNSSASDNHLSEDTAKNTVPVLNSEAQTTPPSVETSTTPVSKLINAKYPFQRTEPTEATPMKIDILGKIATPSPTTIIKPSIAFKQQLTNKLKGLQPVPTAPMNVTDDVTDSLQEKSSKLSNKSNLRKKPKLEYYSSTSEVYIPPTATAWTLVSMKTAADGVKTSRKPVTTLDVSPSENLMTTTPRQTTITPVSRVKSFVPWSTRLQKTSSLRTPTTVAMDEITSSGENNASVSDSEMSSSSSSVKTRRKFRPAKLTEPPPTTTNTQEQSVIRTTLELDRNMTETSINLIQSSLHDIMLKDQSSTQPQDNARPAAESTTTEAIVSSSPASTTVKEAATLEKSSLGDIERRVAEKEKENIIETKQSSEENKSYSKPEEKHQEKVEGDVITLTQNSTVNEVPQSHLSENVNVDNPEKLNESINLVLTTVKPTTETINPTKMKNTSEISEVDPATSDILVDGGVEDGKSVEESDEDFKPKQTTTLLPIFEPFETTVISDLDEDVEGENDKEEEELPIIVDKLTTKQTTTDTPTRLNETDIEVKSTAATKEDLPDTNATSTYVTNLDIVSKENVTQVVTKDPSEGDINWYSIDTKPVNISVEETSPKEVPITTTAALETTIEPETTTETSKQETTVLPEITESVTTASPTTVATMTSTPAMTEEDESSLESVEDPSSCVRLVVHMSPLKLCHSEHQLRESIASQLLTDDVTWEQVVILNRNPQDCQGTTDQRLEVEVCFVGKDKTPSPSLRDEFLKLYRLNTSFPILEVTPTTMSSEFDNVLAAIVLSVIAAICLVLLGILLVIIRKRQGRFNYGERCTPVSLDDYSLDNISVYNSVRRKGGLRASKRSYGNPGFDDPGAPSHPVNFAGLANFSSDREALDEEFNQIPMITVKPDELPAGAESKNRYANVIPLPETRVLLQPKEGASPLDDYINANYIKGPKGQEKLYIACQAPLQSTVEDFWRMVWQQQTKVILMLTALTENGVEKCADYLPQLEITDCHRLFGDFQVTLKKHEVREKYIISSLQLKNLETNLWREVTHLWYSSWPAQGVPEDGSAMIAFLIEARSYMRGAPGPTVVHCSPGTGRTGTVIAVDLCIRDFETLRTVDIPKTVYALRRDRAGAVQTKDQYAFIYQVLNLYATKLTGGALDSI